MATRVAPVWLSPSLSEVHKHASCWDQLEIQDSIELQEIRNEAGSDKISRMYQLWSRSQRRQLLTALRAKHVGENTVEEIYEQELIQMTILSTYNKSTEQNETMKWSADAELITVQKLAGNQILEKCYESLSQVISYGDIRMFYTERVISKKALDEVQRLDGSLTDGSMKGVRTLRN